MCTTCSECVTDVHFGVKTHLCNVHTLPCTSAQNTYCKVHVRLTAGRGHTRPCIYAGNACACTWVRTRAQDTTRHAEAPPPGPSICAYVCTCMRIHTRAHVRVHGRTRICMYTHTGMHACAYVCIHVHTHAHVDVRMHARKHAWNDNATTTG